jgi:hypothetical protein
MQMPFYIYFQSFFLDTSMSDEAAFARGKLVNIGLSVLLLGALHLFFRRTLPRREANVMSLVTAFTIFVFRAGYFQTELLFYTIAFFGFVALCRLWERPSLLLGVVAGVLEAAAYLTKGSVPPGMALFGALFAGREIATAWRSREILPAAKNLAALALMPVSFVVTALPYLLTSKRIYGDYFHNLSSTYVLWFDTWEDFVAREHVLGNWHGWHALPEAAQPIHSAFAYLATHSFFQIAEREMLGLGEVLGNVVIGHGYFEFLALFLGFAVLARPRGEKLAWSGERSDLVFVIPFVVVYTLLFGFYAPIAAGNRFILMLFLPLLWTLVRHGAARRGTARVLGREVAWEDFTRLVLVVAVLHVVFVLPQTITRIYAGG